MRQVMAGLLAVFCIYALAPAAEADDFRAVEHRGCCSHHQGVCGCENDRAKCCDGTLSPTCGCD